MLGPALRAPAKLLALPEHCPDIVREGATRFRRVERCRTIPQLSLKLQIHNMNLYRRYGIIFLMSRKSNQITKLFADAQVRRIVQFGMHACTHSQ